MPKTIDLRPRLLNKPLLMTEESAQSFTALWPESFSIEDGTEAAEEQMFDYTFGGDKARKPYRMASGVAIIPLVGTLLHRLSFSGYGVTGYDYVRRVFDMALEDDDVKGIALDINSGGGEVAGAFDLANHLYQNRNVKPTISIIDESAYSAAYLIGSATGKMTVPKTGGAGSIGVVTMHVDQSKLLDNVGVKVTFIHAGKHKVDGNSFEELAKPVRERIQARINASYDMFVNAVAEQRGLGAKDVRATEAQTFNAEEALNLGLVDAISSPAEALAAFVAELNGESTKETVMAIKTENDSGQQSQAASAEDNTAVIETAKSEGMKAGAQAERDRFMAVMSSEHYKGRETLATKLLKKENLSADDIVEIMEATPVAQAAASTDTQGDKAGGGNHFEQAMDTTGNPNVGAGDDQSADASGEEDSMERIARNYHAATGIKLVK